MSAINLQPVTSAEEVRLALKDHLNQRGYTNVTFRENLSPPYDPRVDDYRVTYEAELVPRDLMHAYLKLLVSEDGKCGIGIETCARVAERMGAYRLTGKRKTAFAVGKELMSISTDELLSLLSIIGGGSFLLRVDRTFMALRRTDILIGREEARDLVRRDNQTWDWISTSEISHNSNWRWRLLNYSPW